MILSYFTAFIFGVIYVIHKMLCKCRTAELARYNPYYTEELISYYVHRLFFYNTPNLNVCETMGKLKFITAFQILQWEVWINVFGLPIWEVGRNFPKYIKKLGIKVLWCLNPSGTFWKIFPGKFDSKFFFFSPFLLCIWLVGTQLSKRTIKFITSMCQLKLQQE